MERNFWRRDPEDSRIIKIEVSAFDSKRWKIVAGRQGFELGVRVVSNVVMARDFWF